MCVKNYIVLFVAAFFAMAFFSSCNTVEKGVQGGEDAVSESGDQTDEESGMEKYRIKVGDKLSVDGHQHKDMNKEVEVDEDGNIILLFVGKVKAEGLTKSGLEEKLVKLYEPKYYKDVQITVTIMTLIYFIGGEIRQPGQKMLIKETTLTEAIYAAGGFTDFAKKSRVKILRIVDGKEKVLHFNCVKIMKGKAKNPIIKPNDQIQVLRRVF